MGCWQDVFLSKRILDPQEPFLRRWNWTFLVLCSLALVLDPLFLYIFWIDNEKKCLGLDKKLETTVTILRSLADIFYVIHIALQFRTGFVIPSSQTFGTSILVEDSWRNTRRYLLSHFLIDILAILPIPQVAFFIIIPTMGGSRILKTKNLLKFVVSFQFVPRFLRIFLLYKEITRTSHALAKTVRTRAAITLFLYVVTAHVCGAFWYLFAIDREISCWEVACRIDAGCNRGRLYCDGNSEYGRFPIDSTFLDRNCPIRSDDSSPFNFSIYFDAIKSGALESRDVAVKVFYCLWWALQNLSTLGQNLKTSTSIWEIYFAFSIFVFGLILVSFVVGILQAIMLSSTMRMEEIGVKWKEVEYWMSSHCLPDDLRKRVRRHEEYRWQKNKGVDVENLMNNLPNRLRRDIKRHLCLAVLKRVPMFVKFDEQLLDEICDYLKPEFYTKESYIFQEGDPVDEMLFIMRGKLLTVTTNGGRTGFFNSGYLKDGDFCGEELLTWALDPHSSSNLPISTRTVRTITEVEAFALMADDLKFVASQFRRLHSKQVHHTFRFYSQQWRTWAACFIQAAWRRYRKKKLEESLRQEENRLQDALAYTSRSSPSFGAIIYALRFAANALRALRRTGTRKASLQHRVPPMLLQKPAEPDFTAEER